MVRPSVVNFYKKIKASFCRDSSWHGGGYCSPTEDLGRVDFTKL